MSDDQEGLPVPERAESAAEGAPRLVVALGASAGGLEALEQFFDRTPPDTGCAFVVVQHLSPGHKSLMAELLARHTRMPVTRATDGVVLRRDHVYLNDARRNLVVDDLTLRLVGRPEPPGINLPIDLFFESLARQWGSRTVGLILSGTGRDGTRGIKAIHAAGGLVLVQDLSTARFDGMPRSAAGTGLAHAVVAPGEMAALIVQALGDPTGFRGGASQRDPESDDEAYVELMALATRSASLDVSHYKRSTVMRRLARRMATTGHDTLISYLRFARGSPAEVEQLANELLIGVTRFFRDPEVFEALQQRVVRPLIRNASEHEPLRFWVAGCATGEEAYTLGILILEEMEAAGRQLDVRIFATDLDRHALDTASAGTYTPASVSAISPDRLERFFEFRDDHYVVRRPLRQLIFFAQHNVVGDPPFTRVSVVTCRNLLIYFDPVLQQRALTAFRFALRPGATLVLGASEGIGELTECFRPIDSRLRIYEATGERAIPELHTPRLTPIVAAAPTRIDERQGLANEATTSLLRKYAPPAVLVDDGYRLLHVFGDVRPHLQLAQGQANLDILSMLPAQLAPVFAAGMTRTLREGTDGAYNAIVTGDGGRHSRVTLWMRPLGETASTPGRRVLVAFESEGVALPAPVEIETGTQLVELKRELEHSRENLHALVEELETSNEELQALNEELTTSNEELQSTNEELQAVNEELQTVNAEYERKIEELKQLNLDVDNILRSTTIGTLLLDEELTVRKFTPAATSYVSLLERDIGRPLEHLALHLGGESLVEDVRRVLADGQPRQRSLPATEGRHVLLRVSPYLTDTARPAGAVISFVDVSSIAEANLRTQKVLDSLPQHVAMVDREGTIVMINAAWARFARNNGSGAELDGLGVGANYIDVSARAATGEDGDIASVAVQFRRLLSGQIDHFEFEYPCHSPTEQRWFVMHATRVGDIGAVVSHVDITGRKIAELQLRELTQVDPLTGLLNRRGLADALTVEANRAGRTSTPFSALLVDCDNFKTINDTAGYEAGDIALVGLTRALVQTLRPSDRVSRIGGDEFVVLLPETRLVEASLVAERVRHAVAERSIDTPAGPLPVTVSVAVIPVDPEAPRLDALLASARDALRQSKARGKNRVTLAASRGARTADPSKPADLAGIIEHPDSIHVVKQPILRLSDGAVVGHELLVRGPEGPLFMPQDFFRRAGEDGVLVALDMRCLRACVQAARGLEGAVHVNLYPSTLRDTPIDQILRLLPGGAARRRFCVELSEQQLYGDPSFIRDAISRLREAQIRLAIDDVGFGRTALEGLVMLEPDVVKLDRRWVAGVGEDRGRLRTLKRLAEVARALGATTIAEGVESDDDLKALLDLGIDMGQGFLWGQPERVAEEQPG